MADKRFILNADDFGMSKDINKAVFDGYSYGLLKSVSLVANGEDFDEAISMISQCPDLGIGVHLNLTVGKSICTDLESLTDKDMKFNNSYFQILLKSYNSKDTEFLDEVEREFRRQIEKVLSKTKVTHIDSHQHIHSIPKIFEIVCRLAKEYGIAQVRTHFEKFYIVPDVHKHLQFKYFINLLRVALFNLFTLFNEAIIHKYELKTNDYVIGLIYNEMVEALTVAYGVIFANHKNVNLEAIIHPCRYEDGTVNHRFDEYLLTKNKKLKEKIEKLGFEITNYAQKDT